MITIGLRAAPTVVTFAIFDSSAQAIVNIEEIKVPAAFAMPDALKYVRSNLLDVLREFGVEHAGLRLSEPNAKSISIPRVQIEGVIQEAFASSLLKGYYLGYIASISSRIGIDRSTFKLLISGEQNYSLDGWEDLKAPSREALLCAIGAVNV